MTALAVRDLSHAYGAQTVLRGVSFTVAEHELVCLLGPSGCGKTTLLRLVAGLERLQQGEIVIAGETVAAPNRHVPPERRGIGLMFQDFSLFPHLTVAENVSFGLKDRTDAAAHTAALLEAVGMAAFAKHYPHEISGGQQQRVALARAQAPEPRLMLLDEPFSDLDTSLRPQIREETVRVLKDRGTAAAVVTHDAEEAMSMADRIHVFDGTGRIVQSGTPDELYLAPATEFVAGLFGPLNRLNGVTRDGRVMTPFGPVATPEVDDGQAVRVLVRPEGFRVGTPDGLPVEVVSNRLLGRHRELVLRLVNCTAPPVTCMTPVPDAADLSPGDVARLSLLPNQAYVFAVDATEVPTLSDPVGLASA